MNNQPVSSQQMRPGFGGSLERQVGSSNEPVVHFMID
jgi:hypothetical protein